MPYIGGRYVWDALLAPGIVNEHPGFLIERNENLSEPYAISKGYRHPVPWDTQVEARHFQAQRREIVLPTAVAKREVFVARHAVALRNGENMSQADGTVRECLERGDRVYGTVGRQVFSIA